MRWEGGASFKYPVMSDDAVKRRVQLGKPIGKLVPVYRIRARESVNQPDLAALHAPKKANSNPVPVGDRVGPWGVRCS